MSNYTYDQLNRIRIATYETVSAPGAGMALTVNPTGAYGSRYTYDLDGNLLKLLRKNATGSDLDVLDYKYYAGKPNQLRNVTDQVPTTPGGNDLPQMLNASISPYVYDATGRLIKDLVSRQDTIRWNIYNKVTQAINTIDKNRMYFGYDGAGNRVSKNVEHTTSAGRSEDREYYVRDASGNILAIYKNNRTYKDSVISLMPYIVDRAYYFGLGDITYREVLTDHYASEHAFQEYLINNGGVTPSQPLSYYLGYLPGTMGQMFQARHGQFAEPVISYDLNSGNNYVGEALNSMGQSGNAHMLWNTIAMGLGGINPEDANQLINLMPNDLLNSAKMTLGIQPFFPPHQQQDMLRSGLSNPPQLQNVMMQAQNQTQPGSITEWLGGLSHSNAWLNEPSFGQAPNVTEQAVIDHADESWFYDFANNWSEGESAFEQVAGSGAKLNVEYSHNTGGFVSQVVNLQGREWTYGALTSIPNFNPQDFAYHLAGRLGLTLNDLMPIYQNITVLKEQQHYLAEHHLYGSSRLGIKNYFPRQVYSRWDYYNSTSPIIDTLNLNLRAPWWSNNLQTMINVGAVEPWGNLLNTEARAQAILGQKGYELTNHLGNVMAVVSDKRYEDGNYSGLVTATKPSLSAAYDYYPFGMLMPGRYVQGASDSCIFTTTSRWMPQWTQTYQYDWLVAYPYEYASAVVWNPFTQNPFSSGVLSVGYPGGGISATLNVPPGVRQNILVPVQSNYGGPFRITATQGVGLDSFELAYQIVQGEGTYMLDFTPTGDNVRLNIIRVMGYNDGVTASVSLLAPRRSILGYNQQNQLVQICPTPKDQYRFGFNGQQKDNEYAGVGNSLDYGDRNYDPRVARWSASDPMRAVYSGLSPYAFGANSPLRFKDADGDILRDLFNNIIATPTGQTFSLPLALKTNDPNTTMTVHRTYEVVNIYSNSGVPIQAMKLVRSYVEKTHYDSKGSVLKTSTSSLIQEGYEAVSDCHGYTFAGGKLWIDDDQVESLLKAEGYKRGVSEKDASAVIYKKSGAVIHSAVRKSNGLYDNDAGIMTLQTNKSLEEAARGLTDVSNPENTEFVKKTSSDQMVPVFKGSVENGVHYATAEEVSEAIKPTQSNPVPKSDNARKAPTPQAPQSR